MYLQWSTTQHFVTINSPNVSAPSLRCLVRLPLQDALLPFLKILPNCKTSVSESSLISLKFLFWIPIFLFQPTNWIQPPPEISPNQSHGGLPRLPLWNPTANPYQNTHKPQNRNHWVRQLRLVSSKNLRQPGPHRPRPLSL